jgi:hypothetical protein
MYDHGVVCLSIISAENHFFGPSWRRTFSRGSNSGCYLLWLVLNRLNSLSADDVRYFAGVLLAISNASSMYVLSSLYFSAILIYQKPRLQSNSVENLDPITLTLICGNWRRDVVLFHNHHRTGRLGWFALFHYHAWSNHFVNFQFHPILNSMRNASSWLTFKLGILNEIQFIFEEIKQPRPEKMSYFFFAGHGWLTLWTRN